MPNRPFPKRGVYVENIPNIQHRRAYLFTGTTKGNKWAECAPGVRQLGFVSLMWTCVPSPNNEEDWIYMVKVEKASDYPDWAPELPQGWELSDE